MQSLLSVEGKVAIVTGASQGQGAAEAALLVDHGASVVLTDLEDDLGEATAAALEMPYLHLDVANDGQWKSVVEQAISRFGHVDILVNNAGISYFNHIGDTDPADFARVMQINTESVFLGMRHLLAAMEGAGGSIVNISSIAGLTGRAGLAAYAASKWAVRGLSRSAVLEFAASKIRVNTVFPGLIDTPMTRKAYGDERMAERGASLPVGRVGKASDVANLVLFLVSDAGAFINGAEIVIDGGETSGQRIG